MNGQGACLLTTFTVSVEKGERKEIQNNRIENQQNLTFFFAKLSKMLFFIIRNGQQKC